MKLVKHTIKKKPIESSVITTFLETDSPTVQSTLSFPGTESHPHPTQHVLKTIICQCHILLSNCVPGRQQQDLAVPRGGIWPDMSLTESSNAAHMVIEGMETIDC